MSGYNLRVSEKPALDQQWYDRLRQITSGSKEVFLMLELAPEVLAQRRQEFTNSGYVCSMDLRPTGLDVALLQATNAALNQLSDDIRDQETNQFIQDAYTARIDEIVLGNSMALAAAAGDHTGFVRANKLLYGTPRPDIFAAAIAWIRSNAQATNIAGAPGLAALQQAVLDALPDVPGGDPQRLMPREKTFREIRTLHLAPGGYRDQLFGAEKLPQQPYIDQTEGDAICRRVIANIGSDYSVAESTDGIWAVLNSAKQVIRPQGYRLDLDEFSGIVCHEIGSHLLEAANGGRQPLRLLQTGLAGFEAGNEGRAYLREQIVYNSEAEFTHQSSWEYILLLYLGVCLASGSYGKSYNFAELYQVFFTLHSFWRERRFPLATNNELSAREESWQLAVRIMKGTAGKVDEPGCYMKDIVYLEGNIACWDIAAHDPGMILQGDIGKFNIANPEHLAILRGLGILT